MQTLSKIPGTLMPREVGAAFLLLISAFLVSFSLPAHTEESKPNVVILYFDDLGWGDFGANQPTGLKIPADSKFLDPGQPTLTPNLDAFAAQSMRFTNGHSADAVCTPSRYAIMTGRYAWRTELKKGVTGGYSPTILEDDRLTIGKMFQQLGYHTAMVGKWHIGMQFYSPDGAPVQLDNGNDREALANNRIDFSKALTDTPAHRGFDYYFGTAASLDMPPYAWIESRDEGVHVLVDGAVVDGDRVDFGQAKIARNEDLKEGDELRNGRPGVYAPGFVAADYLQIQAAKFAGLVERWSQDEQPFFVYLPLPAPHTPHAVQAKFEGSAGFRYGDYVTQTDYYTGQMLDALGDPNDPDSVAANTVVFISSDNGPETGAYTRSRAEGHDANGPYRGMKRDNWEGGTRVPFLVRWPGKVAPGVSDHLCWQGDFFATMADALGYELPAGGAPDGESFLPVLKGETMAADASSRRPGIAQHSSQGQLAVVDAAGEWKLLDGTGGGGNAKSTDAEDRDITDARGEVGGTPRQLFDLKNDPGESTNLLLNPTPEAEAQEQRMLAILAEIRGGDESGPVRVRSRDRGRDRGEARPTQTSSPADSAVAADEAKPTAAERRAARREAGKQRGARAVDIEGAEVEVYKRASDYDLRIYRFDPPGHKPGSDRRPAAVFFFGGSWNTGTVKQFENQARYLAARGMVTFVADYRVQTRQGTTPRECVMDGKSAVRWIRQNADRLGIDPDKIAAGGGSAGGHVAAATGVCDDFEDPADDTSVSSKPNLLLLFNPVSFNGPGGFGADRVQEWFPAISPAHNLSKDDPPSIVFLGMDDKLIPVEQAEYFRDEAKKLGLDTELHLYEGAPHGFFNPPPRGKFENVKDTFLKMDAFLVRHGYLSGDPDEALIDQLAAGAP